MVTMVTKCHKYDWNRSVVTINILKKHVGIPLALHFGWIFASAGASTVAQAQVQPAHPKRLGVWGVPPLQRFFFSCLAGKSSVLRWHTETGSQKTPCRSPAACAHWNAGHAGLLQGKHCTVSKFLESQPASYTAAIFDGDVVVAAPMRSLETWVPCYERWMLPIATRWGCNVILLIELIKLISTTNLFFYINSHYQRKYSRFCREKTHASMFF